MAAGLDTKRPTEVSVDLTSYQNGDDGRRILIGSLWILRVDGYTDDLVCGYQRAV